MFGKEKAMDDFDDLLRDDSQRKQEDRLRGSFQSGAANRRLDLGNQEFGGATFGARAEAVPHIDDFFSRPMDAAGLNRNQDFGFESNLYANNDPLFAPELPGIDQDDLQLGRLPSESFWKTKNNDNPHLIKGHEEKPENNLSIFNDHEENLMPPKKTTVEQEKPVTLQEKVKSPKEAEKKQKSNEKSYKSGPRNEKWEMDIKSDHHFDIFQLCVIKFHI